MLFAVARGDFGIGCSQMTKDERENRSHQIIFWLWIVQEAAIMMMIVSCNTGDGAKSLVNAAR